MTTPDNQQNHTNQTHPPHGRLYDIVISILAGALVIVGLGGLGFCIVAQFIPEGERTPFDACQDYCEVCRRSPDGGGAECYVDEDCVEFCLDTIEEDFWSQQPDPDLLHEH